MDKMIRSCEDCGKDFKTSRHNVRWCEECSIIRDYNPPKNKDGDVNRKYMNKYRNFQSQSIQKQWRESSKKSISKLLSKVSGTNYYN